MSYIEVDQSGKIEDLRQDTILAFSNGNSKSVRLPRKIKRELSFEYRSKVRQFIPKVFAICLFHLLKGVVEYKSSIIICREYTGWDNFIKRELLTLLCQKEFDKKIIRFGIIGKKSNAHRVALLTNRQKLIPHKNLTKKEIIKYLK